MIKYNNANINNFNLGNDNIVKVYKHGAVVFYKMTTSGSTPTFDVCYAVVDDILQYQETEFEDVYDKATEKWYKLNNLNEYEEYGVYGNGRSVTTYNGKLTIDDGYEYEWNGSSWVNVGEVSGSTASLPDVPFVLNYNAKNYDSTTYSIPQTNGQTKDIDAICNYNPNNIVDHSEDGYISVTGNTRLAISGGTTPMYRENTETGCTMTIVSKARTTYNYSILTCRGAGGTSQMNWMWRYPSNGIFLHGSSSYNSVTYYTSTTTSPITASIRVTWDGGVKQQINDWTNNGSYSGNFGYGSHESVNNNGSLFCDYLTTNGEFWNGDFYWVYMSQEVLSDEEIQQVIAYNEGGGGTPTYPMYYAEMQDPPNNVSFSSMTEAEEYAYNNCVYNGMKATIAGTIYIFSGDSQSGYEWVEKPSRLPSGYTEVEYIENATQAYINTGFKPNQNTRITCEMQCVSSTTSVLHFGTGGWNKVDGMWLTYESGINGTLHISWLGKTTWSTYSSVHGDYNKHTYDWDKNNIYKDNVLVASSTLSNYSCPDNLAIFTTILNGTSYESSLKMLGRVYWFKIYDNGTLVRDFIPCTRDSDSKAGVYDIINDVFYGSANNYNFVAGNPIN